ncbi:MAG: polyphenol oxidase family protein [Actinomycetota bacterium]|nr:polyphenol oxidase family protein [Actinomycetota bacterium]
MTQIPSPSGAVPASGRPGAAPGIAALGPAMVRWTGKRDGDMGDPTGVDAVVQGRRRSVIDLPWTWLTQVHGAGVAVVDGPGGSAGVAADAAVSAAPGVALAVITADCAPVAFASPEGVIGVAHAGWRGLVGGVIEETVLAMRGLGARSVLAALGPCIHPECYAFGPADLDAAADHFGPTVRALTSEGHPAFDIPGAVRVALERAGAALVVDAGVCTSCSGEHWSWRARRDRPRQATVVWQS